MSSKGFYRIETIRWIKVTRDGKQARRGGRYIWHTSEDCLVFKRKETINSKEKFMLEKAVDLNIISAVMAPSAKPIQLYELVEKIVPKGPYMEYFCREHNRRIDWISVGMQVLDMKKGRPITLPATSI